MKKIVSSLLRTAEDDIAAAQNVIASAAEISPFAQMAETSEVQSSKSLLYQRLRKCREKEKGGN